MTAAADEAYDIIRRAIATGQYGGGMHLKEEEMAEQTGLSRTPIRQALQRLHSEGWVIVIFNRGTFVRTFDEADMEQATNVRLLLEPYAAELAATRMQEAQFAALHELNAEMERAVKATPPRLDVIQKVNDEFHKTIIAASNNERLRFCLQSVVEAPVVFRTFSRFTPVQLRRSLAHHKEITAALEARDPAWAKAMMLAHISAGRPYFGGEHKVASAPPQKVRKKLADSTAR